MYISDCMIHVTNLLIIYQTNYEHIEAKTKWPHFEQDIFKFIYLNDNCCILIQIILKFVPKGLAIHIHASVQKMAYVNQATSHYRNKRRPSLLTHVCINRSQWICNYGGDAEIALNNYANIMTDVLTVACSCIFVTHHTSVYNVCQKCMSTLYDSHI